MEAKNSLENYCFTMRNTLQEEKLKEKFEEADKETIETAVKETLDWLDRNQLAEKDEFEAKQKELEAVVKPDHDEGVPGGRRWRGRWNP